MTPIDPNSGERFVAVDEDEPPSLRPQGAHGADTPSVAAADERHDVSVPAVELDSLATLLGRALGELGAPAGAEASLRLVDPDEIAELKAQYLDGDGSATDVLSFPVDGVATDAELIGDVVLCPAVAAAQAGEHAGTEPDEYALLVVHAALHLAGYDHAEPDERRRMWAEEQRLLERLHGPLTLNPWSEN